MSLFWGLLLFLKIVICGRSPAISKDLFCFVLFYCDRKCKTELKSAKAQNEELRRMLELMEGRIRARVGRKVVFVVS